MIPATHILLTVLIYQFECEPLSPPGLLGGEGSGCLSLQVCMHTHTCNYRTGKECDVIGWLLTNTYVVQRGKTKAKFWQVSLPL